MSINLEIRLKQLESLEQYISSSRDKIQSILDCFKWNTEDVLKDTRLIRCSVDPNHRVPVESVDTHVAKCSLRKEGYDIKEQFLSEPQGNSKSSIFIDDHKKIEILSDAHKEIPHFKSAWNGQDPDPKTSDRSYCTFSTDERLALYSYAVSNTAGPRELPEFNTIQPKSCNKEPTYEELRMQERDAKRRRLKYKSVHNNKKSHTEVLHEVIEGQMDSYRDWLTGSDEPKAIDQQIDDVIPQTAIELKQENKKSNSGSISEHSQYGSSRHSSVSSRRSKDKAGYRHKRYDEDYNGKHSRHDGRRNESHKSYDTYKYKDRERSRSRHGRDDSSHHRSKRR